MLRFIKSYIGLYSALIFSLVLPISNAWSLEYIPFSSQVVDIANYHDAENITRFTQLFITQEDFSFDSVRSSLGDDLFKVSGKSVIKYPYTHRTLWGKLNLTNKSNKAVERIYYWATPLSDYVEFFFKDRVFYVGSSIAVSKRANKTIYPSLKIKLEPGETQSLYFKRSGHHNLVVKIYLSDQFKFQKLNSDRDHQFILYVSIFFIIIIHNLFMGYVFKNMKYFMCCLFSLSFLSVVLNSYGILDHFELIKGSTLSTYTLINTTISMALLVEFSFYFLDGRTHLNNYRVAKNVLIGAILMPLVILPLPLADFQNYVIFFGYFKDFTLIMGLIFLSILCVTALKRKALLAKYYLFSWISLFFGGFLFLMYSYGFGSSNFIVENGLLLGSVGEMFSFSLGLAYQSGIVDLNSKKAFLKEKDSLRYQDLVRTISHDISNSMQILFLCTRRLLIINKEERVAGIITKMQYSTENIMDILKEVKAREKLLHDQKVIVFNKLNVNNILNESILIFEEELRSKNIIVKVDIPYDCQFIHAERLSFKNSILGNILSNAIKFSPESSVIQIRASRLNGRVRLTFFDNGNGLDELSLDYLNSTAPYAAGDMSFNEVSFTEVGLGLKLMKSYVEISKGEISAENRNGAMITLDLMTT